MQRNRLPNIGSQFVESGCLGYDRQVQTLSHIFLFASKDPNLNRAFHGRGLLNHFTIRATGPAREAIWVEAFTLAARLLPLLVAAAASLLSARRASKLDPMVTVRDGVQLAVLAIYFHLHH
jgi:hypothetical protein